MKRTLLASLLSLWTSMAFANVVCTLPFNLQNNTTADATQVMANYNAIVSCLANAAAAGTNTDITALLGLTTPITPARGGSNVFIGGTSTGSAIAQVVTTTVPPTGFSLTNGYTVIFTFGFSTGAGLTLNINGTGATTVLKRSTAGLVAVAATDGIAGQLGIAIYDGTQFELMEPASLASLSIPDQLLTGGANVTSLSITSPAPSSTLTIDCGLRPLQFLTNSALFTLAGPANDGACDILIFNSPTAGAITPSGFTVNANTGEPYTTVNGSAFIWHIERINGVKTFMIKALQ